MDYTKADLIEFLNFTTSNTITVDIQVKLKTINWLNVFENQIRLTELYDIIEPVLDLYDIHYGLSEEIKSNKEPFLISLISYLIDYYKK